MMKGALAAGRKPGGGRGPRLLDSSRRATLPGYYRSNEKAANCSFVLPARLCGGFARLFPLIFLVKSSNCMWLEPQLLLPHVFL